MLAIDPVMGRYVAGVIVGDIMGKMLHCRGGALQGEILQ